MTAQDILIDFWRHKDVGEGFRAKCYIWCTSDGQPPVTPQESVVPSELESARAQDSVNVVQVGTNRTLISTNNIYRVVQQNFT